jgi:hypothetical protein
VSLSELLDTPPYYPMLLGAAACVFLRIMAIYHGWHVPVAQSRRTGDQ